MTDEHTLILWIFLCWAAGGPTIVIYDIWRKESDS